MGRADLTFPRIALGAGLLLLLAGQGWARGEDLASPRLSALRKEVEAGGQGPLKRFWQRLVAEGTPLVEPVEGEANPMPRLSVKSV
jgi:hypothetical protein